MTSPLRKPLPPARRPKGPLKELQERLGASDQEMSLLLRVNPRTLHRWSETPPEDHAPLLQLEALVDLAQKSLRKEALGEWFHERNRALGGSIPIIQAADPRGYELVYNLLWDAFHGLPL